MNNIFRKISVKIAEKAGSAYVFVLALALIALWASSGPMFRYSDTWQLIINTTTTIVTFLMVFLIQNTQNRSDKAIQLKLDELILATKARDALIDLENMSDEEIDEFVKEFQAIHLKQQDSKTIRDLRERLKKSKEERRFFIVEVVKSLSKFTKI